MQATRTDEQAETGRLEAFSDGVFSVAITLLVLGLTVPRIADLHPGHRLAAALLDQWPSYLAYALSFLNVLIMWVNHHALFRIIRRTDHLFLLLNGLLLLMEPFFEDASPYMFADQVDLTGLEKVNEKYNTQIVGPPLPA